MSIKRGATKLPVLKDMAKEERIAVPDYGNLYALVKLGPNAVPAVTLRVCWDYGDKSYCFDRVRLYAFTRVAYRKLCHLITEACHNFRYEPRIKFSSLVDAVDEDLLAIVEEDFKFLSDIKSDHFYLAVNADSTVFESHLRPIFFYESQTIGVDIAVANALGVKLEEGYFEEDRHGRVVNKKCPLAITNYLYFMNRPLEKLDMRDRLPVFREDGRELFRALAYAGFLKRYPDHGVVEDERYSFEMSVIESMGFESYFLIVWDFISWARKQDIPVGPGRGSAAGSMIAYCLGITQACPIKNGLYFERFLNPSRISMPDMDIDIAQTRRGEVIHYLSQKYGSDRVSQIVTIGTMRSKSAFKAAGRVHGVTPEEQNRVTKLWPPPKFGRPPTLEEVFAFNAVQEWVNKTEINRVVWEDARRLEDFATSHGVHAAGVIISPDVLADHVPVSLEQDKEDKDKKIRVCHFDMRDAEKYGLLKMDLLGLETLDVIDRACKLVGIEYLSLFDIVPLDDAKVLEAFCFGDTHGIFQFESPGMRGLLGQIKPTSFDDIAAATALFRPGPLQCGLAADYVTNKNSETKKLLVPEFATLLEDTYGVMVYQEQIMKIVRELGGFSMARADVLRKAIGKKDQKLMGSMRDEFLAVAGEDKQELWTAIEKFGDYCFNKSHSVAYSLLSFYAMWLKVHHPKEFALAMLTQHMHNPGKMAHHFFHLRETFKFEYPLMGKCDDGFKFIDDTLMVGLGSVKSLSNSGRFIGRSWESIGEFLTDQKVGKKDIEQLVRAGFFDELVSNRQVLLGNVSQMMSFSAKRNESKKKYLFDFDSPDDFMLDPNAKSFELPSSSEFMAFGYNLKEGFIVRNAELIQCFGEGVYVGVVYEVKRIRTANGAEMANVSCHTLAGPVKITIFPQLFAKSGFLVEQDATLIFDCKLDEREDREPSLIANNIMHPDNFVPRSVIVRDQLGWSRDRALTIPRFRDKKIPLYYEGEKDGYMENRLIGSLDFVTSDFLTSVPPSCEVLVKCF